MGYNSKYTGAEIESAIEKANTAVQPSALSSVATSGSYNDLSNKPTIPSIEGLATVELLEEKVDKVEGKGLSSNDYTTQDKTKLDNLHPTMDIVHITSTDGVSYSVTVPSIDATDISQLIGRSIVIIPDKESTSANVTLNVNGLGACGIKRGDSIQSHDYWGYSVTNWLKKDYPAQIMFNGTYWIMQNQAKTYASDLYGIIPIEKGGTGATTASSALTALGGQPQLVSGTNIKTVNGTSLLGSGDIAIESGSNIPISNETATTKAIYPNVFYVWGTMSSLTITLTTPANSNIYNEYMFQFISGRTATTLSLPSDVVILNNTTIEANKTYQVSIVKGLAVVCGFDIKAQGCCFVAGTQVTMADGTTKNIEDIKEGESVLSYDVETNENYETIVKNLIVNPCSINMARVTLEDGTSVTMNEYHPLLTQDGWKSLTNYNSYPILTESDSLFKEDLSYVKISSIERWAEPDPVITYYLDVRDNDEVIDIDANDNFFVNGICAHNAVGGHY